VEQDNSNSLGLGSPRTQLLKRLIRTAVEQDRWHTPRTGLLRELWICKPANEQDHRKAEEKDHQSSV
jgi:hypothetical protein